MANLIFAAGGANVVDVDADAVVDADVFAASTFDHGFISALPAKTAPEAVRKLRLEMD
jgi:hypothetical protein